MADAVVDAGAAWRALAVGTGEVVAVFSRAAYLRFGDAIVAVGCAEGFGYIPAGPLHLRTPSFVAASLAVGGPAVIDDGFLRAGHLVVDLRSARRWAPPSIDPYQLVRRAASWAAPAADFGLERHVVGAAGVYLRRGELVPAIGLLGGLGPGLTPAGDDVLAGFVLLDALLRPAAHPERTAAVARNRTNDVALSFLRWAAVGQSIQPAHDLLGAIAADDEAGRVAATTEMLAVGASSGAALLYGIELGLRATRWTVTGGGSASVLET